MNRRTITQPLVPLALTAALVGGCVAPAGVSTPNKPLTLAKGTGALKPKPGASNAPVTGGPGTQPGGTSPLGPGGSLITDNGGGLISNNAGNLVGIAKAPSHLITDNGGGLITDNGGGLITDNGGGYRVLAVPEQKLVAGATVAVLDAAGNPVLDAAGKPLTTTTNAKGEYAFRVPEPARHLIVRITLPGDKGAISAIALKEHRGTKPLEADLISTLTTGYVVSQYLKGQTDPGAALAKLPADVEAETRAKAAEAYGKAQIGTLPALSPTEVVSTVEKLKAADAPFAEQMEKVRKLLVAAGASDLGAGRLGTEVALGGIRTLAVADDGTVYINSANTHRVWRLAADGRLYTAAGNGTPVGGSLDGKPGAEAGLYSPLGVTVDGQGRPLIVEGAPKRVSRVEADGRIKAVVLNLARTPRAVGAAADGRLHGVSVEGDVAEYWTAMPGESAVVQHTFAAGEVETLKAITTYGLDAKGRLCFSTGDKKAHRFDPATKALTAVAAAAEAAVIRASFDGRGNLFVIDQVGDGRRIRVVMPDDTVKTLIDKAHSLLLMGAAVALSPDGKTAWFDSWGVVQRLEAGKLTGVAGTSAAKATSLDDLVLSNPSGVAFLSTGELVVADSNLGSKVWKVKADRSVARIAGGGGVDRNLAGGEAAEMRLGFISRVKTDASGQVYFYESTTTEQTIRRLDTAGKLHTIYRATDAEPFRDLAVAPDGTVYISLAKLDAAKQVLPEKTVWRLKPGETTPSLLLTETLAHDTTFTSFISLAVGPDGALYLALTHNDVGYLKRWTEAQGLQTLKQAPQFKVLWGTENTSMAIDGQGRVYVANSWDNQLHRYDPALGSVTLVAGKGSARFGGAGVDDSLEKPRFPAFNAAGDLYFADSGHQQVKFIPAADLP